MAQQYNLCDECNSGVANDDWSHLDDQHDDPVEADREFSAITATLEALGRLVPSHTGKESGYFDCAVCDDIQCGNPNVWEAIA